MNVQTVADAFVTALKTIDGVEVYARVPSQPVLPALMVFPERVPYPVTQEATFVVWCVAGSVDDEDAWSKLADWTSDDASSSIYNAVAAVTAATWQASASISAVLPVEMRNWGKATLTDGRDVVQAELVFSVWR